jgi:hypothetical protein
MPWIRDSRNLEEGVVPGSIGRTKETGDSAAFETAKTPKR